MPLTALYSPDVPMNCNPLQSLAIKEGATLLGA